MDIAPFLTEKIANYHFANGMTPIVIYPETFNVSKFNAPFKVRYLLNYSQLLFANNSLEGDDYLIAYSEDIAEKIVENKPIKIILLPVSDPLFYHPPQIEKRKGSVFYAGKYKYHFGGKTFPITDGLPEITRDEIGSQTPSEIRKLFQESEFFYCYEDSALALEAMLCGCPTIFLPNEHFKEPLSQKEILGLGYAWGTSLDQIEHAKKTVHLVRGRYQDLLEIAHKDVNQFITQTQNFVKDIPYVTQFAKKEMRKPSLIRKTEDLMYLLVDNIKDRGMVSTVQTIIKRILSGRIKLF